MTHKTVVMRLISTVRSLLMNHIGPLSFIISRMMLIMRGMKIIKTS